MSTMYFQYSSGTWLEITPSRNTRSTADTLWELVPSIMLNSIMITKTNGTRTAATTEASTFLPRLSAATATAALTASSAAGADISFLSFLCPIFSFTLFHRFKMTGIRSARSFHVSLYLSPIIHYIGIYSIDWHALYAQ